MARRRQTFSDQEALERVVRILSASVLTAWSSGTMGAQEFEVYKEDTSNALRLLANEILKFPDEEAVSVVEEVMAVESPVAVFATVPTVSAATECAHLWAEPPEDDTDPGSAAAEADIYVSDILSRYHV